MGSRTPGRDGGAARRWTRQVPDHLHRGRPVGGRLARWRTLTAALGNHVQLVGGGQAPGGGIGPWPGEDGQSELAGALSEHGLYFILRTMVGLGRSGFVQVERGKPQRRAPILRGGPGSGPGGVAAGSTRPCTSCSCGRRPALEIKFRPVVRLGQSLPSGEGLLEDCERFLRDFAHATKNIGHAQSLFVQDAERVARLLDSIPAEVVPVMRLFDGQRSLGDVLEDSPFRVFDTLRTITRLLDMGIIRRKAIERPTTGFQHLRRTRGEEWVRPGPETSPAANPPDASPASPDTDPESPQSEQRLGRTRRRAPRRRTGEHPTTGSLERPRAPTQDALRSIHRWRWSRRPRARPPPPPWRCTASCASRAGAMCGRRPCPMCPRW